MEHHSNLVPWQLAKRTGAKLEFIPVTGDDGALDLSQLDEQLDRAKLLSFTHISNTMGSVNPATEFAGALVKPESSPWSMPPKVPDTPSTFARLAAIFAFPATRFVGQPASACFTPTRVTRHHAALSGWRRNDHQG